MIRDEVYDDQRASAYLGGGLGALGLTTPVVSYGPRAMVMVWIFDLGECLTVRWSCLYV